MERKKLYQLQSREYEHDFDRKALETLEGTPGLEKLVRKINKHGVERGFRLGYTGSNIKVTPKNFPDIYKLLEVACDLLGLIDVPDLYIEWNYDINAMAVGSENPIIILYSGAIDLLTPDELLYIIGHEVGHIKSGHMLYHDMAIIIPFIGEVIGSATLGIGSLVSSGLELALLYWVRMSELTADRAGLLACQDINVALSALMKMGGVPKNFYDKMKIEDFIEQAKEFQGYDYDTLDKIAKIALIMVETHPWTVMRAHELLKWTESGQYDTLVEKHSSVEMISGTSGKMPCLKCGFELSGQEKFCPGCGEKFGRR